MDEGKLLGLAVLAGSLSLLSFGGGQTIVAELNHQTVAVHGWLTGRQFADLFAISRAAPGPSTLMLALIGWQVGGLLGAVLATLAVFIPSSVLICVAAQRWHRYKTTPWAIAIERGLVPVAVGLIFAGAFAVAQSSELTTVGYATIALSAAALYFTKIGPYSLLGIVGLFYFCLALWQT
jgi:chromate transporter